MKRIIAIFLILLCAAFSGCSVLSLEEEDILSIPRASGDESEIISLIAENFSSSFELVYPRSGQNKSAVILGDSDKDPQEKAVAVFRYPDDPGYVTLLFAKKQNGSFTYLGSSEISTAVIDRVDFADLDGNGRKEILVGYQGTSPVLKSIAVYQTDDAMTVIDVPACYQSLVYGDFNADGADEALCVVSSSDGEASAASLMGYHPVKGLAPISSCELNADAVQTENILFGQISENVCGAVIDSSTLDGALVTDAVYYDKDQKLLIDPLFIFDDLENTTRNYPLYSADIDFDGVTEIPVTEETSSQDGRSFCDTVRWVSLDLSIYTTVIKKTAIVCPDGSYTFALGTDKEGMVAAVYDEEQRRMTFYGVDDARDGAVSDEALMYIQAYDKADYHPSRVIEATLCELSDTVYTYLITDTESEVSFTDDEAEKGFELVSPRKN